jgi:hypothetical protein
MGGVPFPRLRRFAESLPGALQRVRRSLPRERWLVDGVAFVPSSGRPPVSLQTLEVTKRVMDCQFEKKGRSNQRMDWNRRRTAANAPPMGRPRIPIERLKASRGRSIYWLPPWIPAGLPSSHAPRYPTNSTFPRDNRGGHSIRQSRSGSACGSQPRLPCCCALRRP